MDGALAAAAYAFDDLGADGVVLLANVRGHYLGDPGFDPLLADLDRRRALVFIHPSELPGPAVPGIPPFAADFLLDITRAAINLVRNGALQRYPNIKFILSHAGGFLPFASHRIGVALAAATERRLGEVLEDLRSFYFDTALSASRAALPSLFAFARPGQVFFGSDWPFAPAATVRYFAGQLDGYDGLDDQGHAAIDRTSAETLFPRFMHAVKSSQ